MTTHLPRLPAIGMAMLLLVVCELVAIYFQLGLFHAAAIGCVMAIVILARRLLRLRASDPCPSQAAALRRQARARLSVSVFVQSTGGSSGQRRQKSRNYVPRSVHEGSQPWRLHERPRQSWSERPPRCSK